MPQTIACPHCSRQLKAPDHLAGKRVPCPACKGAIDVPAMTAGSFADLSSMAHLARKQPAKAAEPAHAAVASIVAACPGCGKKLKAPPSFSGKRVRCPSCQAAVTIPGAAEMPPREPARPAQPAIAAVSSPVVDDDFLGLEPPVTRGFADLVPATEASASIPAVQRSAPPAPASDSPKAPATPSRSHPSNETPLAASSASRAASRRPRFLYLLFVVALIPLGISTLGAADPEEPDVEERFFRAIASQPEFVNEVTDEDSAIAFFESHSEDELWELLPDARIEGAFLSHNTWIHWAYGFAAAAVFMGIIFALFEFGKAPMWKLAAVMATTGTVGVLSLILFQFIAEATQGVWVRGRGVIVILFYIVKLIGYSYNAASDPENGFLLSMIGFTVGVGLCEELTKVLPAVGVLGQQQRRDSRRPVSWGWPAASALAWPRASCIPATTTMASATATFIWCASFRASPCMPRGRPRRRFGPPKSGTQPTRATPRT